MDKKKTERHDKPFDNDGVVVEKKENPAIRGKEASSASILTGPAKKN